MKKICSITLVLGMLCTMLAIPSFATESNDSLTQAVEIAEADAYVKKNSFSSVSEYYSLEPSDDADKFNRWPLSRTKVSDAYVAKIKTETINELKNHYVSIETESEVEYLSLTPYDSSSDSLYGTVVFEAKVRFAKNSALTLNCKGSTDSVFAPGNAETWNDKYLIGNGNTNSSNKNAGIIAEVANGEWIKIKIIGTPTITGESSSKYEWEYFIGEQKGVKGSKIFSDKRADCLKKIILNTIGTVDIDDIKLYRIFKSPVLEAVSTSASDLSSTVIMEGADSIILDFNKEFVSIGTVKVNNEIADVSVDFEDSSKYIIKLPDNINTNKNTKLNILISGEDTVIENVTRRNSADASTIDSIYLGEKDINIPIYVGNDDGLYIEKNDEGVTFVNGGDELSAKLIKAVYTSSEKNELARLEFVKNSTIATGINEAISISGGVLNDGEYSQLFIWENDTLKPLDS